ncbi:hypothetical protein GCM10010965_29260 [Caldalkalibacillus thermarum]|nr:hypothetical protein GCM10010965_29260 [Caldalkalibacillus thermarum]
MAHFRQNPPETLAGQRVTVIEDYLSQKRHEIETGKTEPITLPQSNVLKYICEDESWVALRPSERSQKLNFTLG